MKKIIFTILASVLLLIPTLLFAYDDHPKGIFKCQQDIEGDVSEFSRYSSTIPFNGLLYNFVYYSSGDKIIVRILTPNSGRPAGTMHFTVEKKDDIPAFDNASTQWHQPAPVIYNGLFYCFFVADNNKLGYSTYNPESNVWQEHVALNISPNISSNEYLVRGGMVAVVLQNKLCIFYKGPIGLECLWAEDDALQVWHREYLGFNNAGDAERFESLSAVTTYITYNNRREEIAMLGYVNPGYDAYCARYTFNNGQFVAVSAPTLISSSYNFQCVALAEGSVTGDGNISGKCIQAFVKREDLDKNFMSHRILRYRTLNTNTESWTKQESNLVDQNNNEWASKGLNLTVANIGVPAGSKCMKQFMCLIYRAYDNINNPLNSAWAETDSLHFVSRKDSTLRDPSRVTYIGYIEGAPPYHINHDYFASEYQNKNNNRIISSAEFTKSGSTGTSDEYKVEAGIKVKNHAKFFQGEFQGGYMENWENEKTFSYTITDFVEAGAANQTYGTLLYTAPVLTRDKYCIYDRQGKKVDSTYCYYIKENDYHKEVLPLQFNLNSSDPTTFAHRMVNNGIDLVNNYDPVGSDLKVDMSFLDQSGGREGEIGIETTDVKTHGVKIDCEVGVGMGEKWFAGVYGKFEYTTTNTTIAGADIDILINLNSVVDSSDCLELAYKAYWIKPSEIDAYNWWVPLGAPDSDIWCLTYEVTSYVLKGGKDGPIILVGPSKGDQTGETSGNSPLNPPAPDSVEIQKGLPATSGLSQNYPNPFKGTTRIRYSIGKDNSAESMTSLSVYNLNGSQVATLVNENKAPGSYEVELDASQFTPGVYFYSLQSGSFKDVKKLVLLK